MGILSPLKGGVYQPDKGTLLFPPQRTWKVPFSHPKGRIFKLEDKIKVLEEKVEIVRK